MVVPSLIAKIRSGETSSGKPVPQPQELDQAAVKQLRTHFLFPDSARGRSIMTDGQSTC